MPDTQVKQKIDWTDIKVAFFVGCVFIVIKSVLYIRPGLYLGNLDSLVPFLLCILYTINRARHQPEKLDEWGITTPITPLATIVMLMMLGVGIGCLAALGLSLSGELSFKFRYASRMVEYIVSAFPQQFFLCSVILVSLSKVKMLHGQWRLPLVVGLLFALAHFWTPFHIPGTKIPLQLVGTFPVGFMAAWYFLKFRTLLPLVLSHAVLYVLLNRWVEAHL